MNYTFNRLLNELDPEKKTAERANELIRDFRTFMVPLVSSARAQRAYSYLLAEQDVDQYKKKFHEPDKLPFKFEQLDVFGKFRYILRSEREKAGIYLQLNAINPTAEADRQKDKELLENKGTIEGVMNYIQRSTGQPEYKLLEDTDEQGNKVTNGNLKNFEEMGLNPRDPSDIAYFFNNYYKLDVEIEAEDVVNYFVKAHEMQEFIKVFCDDVMAVNALAFRVYTDQYTFLPEKEYLRPDSVFWIPGVRRDGKDAMAIMSRKTLTVAEFSARVGIEINQQTIDHLLEAANFYGGKSYNTIHYSDGSTYSVGNEETSAINYSDFLNLKVSLGYIEWKEIDAEVDKVGINSLGNLKRFDAAYSYHPSPQSKYRRDENQMQRTYKAYFLERTSSSHDVYDFGPLFDMHTHGAEDEYSSYSFQLYYEPGKSAIEKSIPHINAIHDAWYKFLWILNRAKPKGRTYNYSVLAKIGAMLYKDDSNENRLTKVIEFFNKSVDDFYVNDNLNEKLGGGQNPHFDKPNGFDNMIKDLLDVMNLQEEKIGSKLGVNSIREAYSPSPNDGYKLQMQALAQSRNATEYINRMIMSVLNNYSIVLVQIVQDMIEFKGSKAAKYLEKAIGNKAVTTLRSLKRIPLHKYGIFVESFNTDLERMEKKQQAMLAYQQKEIPYHVYLLLEQADNYKRQGQILAREKKKEQERLIEAENRKAQQAMQLQQDMNNFQLAKIDREGEWEVKKQEEINKGLMAVKDRDVEGRIDVTSMKLDNEPLKNRDRTNNKIREKEETSRIESGKPSSISEV
jgi:hypothetical protein